LLGEDSAAAPVENALLVPVSAQVLADLPRRLRIAKSMLAGDEPDFSAPFAERPSGSGAYGEACGFGTDATFLDWSCAPGLTCSGSEVAAGVPLGHCSAAEHGVGDACEAASLTQDVDARRDRVSRPNLEDCPSMICNRSSVGFPGGMCTAPCGAGDSTCGAIAILEPFNACLGRGESFLSCIRGNVMPAGLRPCDAEHACRDDYVCARSASGGVCLPPYFVFQLRVDGHSIQLRTRGANAQ
jgi:hypothetical protein